MSTGRPCSICSSADKARLAAEMIASGATDQAIANQLGGGLHRMAVSRHRRAHVVAPAKALAEAAGKGRDAIEQRAQVMAAAEAGDPSAFVALAGIVADLRKVHERLERTASAAEQDNQRLAVSALSAQQLRAAEVRAKIGGVGGYAPQKAPGTGDGTPFVLNIVFSGDRPTQTITGFPVDAVPAIGEDAQHAEDGAMLDTQPPSAEMRRLAAAFGARSGRRPPSSIGFDRLATASAQPGLAEDADDDDI